MGEKNNQINDLWLRVCQLDDSKAFESLFALYYHKLLNFCLLYLDQKEPAEEVVSDVFVKCWMNRQNLAQVQNPEVYLFVAVKNQSLNYLRRFSNYHMVSIGEVDADRLINSLYPDKEVEQRELLLRMNHAIASLPRQCRVIFRLIKEDGMKYKEVAEILHISPRTVQTQLFRGIEKLRTALRPYLEGGRSGKASPSGEPSGGGDEIILPFILLIAGCSRFFL